jgi:hypothetical protein
VNKPPTVLLKDSDVEAEWGKAHGYMSDLRARGLGPIFVRLGPRTVRYLREDLDAYIAQQRFHNVAESLASDFKAPAKAASTNVESLPIRKRIASGSYLGPDSKQKSE